MRALIHDQLVTLASDDARVLKGWAELFDRELAAATGIEGTRSSDLHVEACVTTQLPQLPDLNPTYTEPPTQTQPGGLRFYKTAAGGIIQFMQPSQIHFDLQQARATLLLTPATLDIAAIEDGTMVALAPLLRRSGLYMVHSFAATRESAILLCGPSGSGKTTAGLALIQAGWRYLANDVAFLHRMNDVVFTLPAPGVINIRSRTIGILPQYRERLTTLPDRTNAEEDVAALSRRHLFTEDELGRAAPVAAILFPSISTRETISLHEISPALCLARLLEESVDLWDRAIYEDHIDILTKLSLQAPAFDIHLPLTSAHGLDNLAAILTSYLP